MSQYRGFGGDDLPDPRVLVDHIKRNLRFVVLGIGLILILALAAGSIFTVEPEEQAVVLRFGVPLEQDFVPGLHFKIPIVDQVYIVPVKRQQSIEIGFRSEPNKVTTVTEKGYDRESLMLTGDLSLAHVRFAVLFKVKDIRRYVFNIKDQQENVRDISQGVVRAVIGDYALDEAMMGEYGPIAARATERLQGALDEVESGIEVIALTIKSIEVPREAKKAFDDLNRSVAEVRGRIIAAQSNLKGSLGTVVKEKEQLVGLANKRRELMVAEAQGMASAFETKLRAYQIAPAITMKWLYLEAMSEILSGVQDKIILDGSESGVLKHLWLGEEPNALGQGGPPPKPRTNTRVKVSTEGAP